MAENNNKLTARYGQYCLFKSSRASVFGADSAATVFTPYTLGTDGQELNHTRSMSLSDLELQYGQASAVLPVTRQQHSNIDLAV